MHDSYQDQDQDQEYERPLPLPESISRPVVPRVPPGGPGGGPLPQGATAKPMEKP